MKKQVSSGFGGDSKCRRFVAAFAHIFGEMPGFIETFTPDSTSLLFHALGTPDIRLMFPLAGKPFHFLGQRETLSIRTI